MKRIVCGLLLLTALMVSSCAPAYPDLFISMMYFTPNVSHGTDTPTSDILHELTIDHNGNVSYVELQALTSGIFDSPQGYGYYKTPYLVKRSRLTPQQAQELAAAIEKANVWAMADLYEVTPTTGYRGPWTAIQITLNGRYKMITHYGTPGFSDIAVIAAVPALFNLEDRIKAYIPK